MSSCLSGENSENSHVYLEIGETDIGVIRIKTHLFFNNFYEAFRKYKLTFSSILENVSLYLRKAS